MQYYAVERLLHVVIAVYSVLHFSVSLRQRCKDIVNVLYADMLYAVMYMHVVNVLYVCMLSMCSMLICCMRLCTCMVGGGIACLGWGAISICLQWAAQTFIQFIYILNCIRKKYSIKLLIQCRNERSAYIITNKKSQTPCQHPLVSWVSALSATYHLIGSSSPLRVRTILGGKKMSKYDFSKLVSRSKHTMVT